MVVSSGDSGVVAFPSFWDSVEKSRQHSSFLANLPTRNVSTTAHYALLDSAHTKKRNYQSSPPYLYIEFAYFL
jgi:hypothetical protein